MKQRSSPEMVQKRADDPIDPSEADLERLRRMSDEPVDTSDIAEGTIGKLGGERDEHGRLPQYAKGPLCRTILDELGRRGMTRYQLWQAARQHCPTLPESAVYEYLRGRRQITTHYLEALLKALDLEVRRRRAS